MRVIVLLRRVILSRSLCRRLKILLDVNGILMIRFCTPCFASTYSKMSLNTQVDQALALGTICETENTFLFIQDDGMLVTGIPTPCSVPSEDIRTSSERQSATLWVLPTSSEEFRYPVE